MKNKKGVYLLVILIAAIWAFIIYRFFASSSSATNPELHSTFIAPVLNSNASDTFSISANYRDPFLGRTEAKILHKGPTVPAPPKKAIEPLKWPTVTYGGMIKSRKSNSQLCMVVINGQSSFMKEGDVNADVQLRKVYKDSIEVVFQKEKRVVKK